MDWSLIELVAVGLDELLAACATAVGFDQSLTVLIAVRVDQSLTTLIVVGLDLFLAGCAVTIRFDSLFAVLVAVGLN